MSVKISSLDHPEVAPLAVSSRFLHEVAYFAAGRGEEGIPVTLGEGEYWIDLDSLQTIYDDGVVRLVSPLDSETTAELELSEEQERILEWLLKHRISHIRLNR